MHTSYYTLLLIPLGIALCIVIKFLSDSSITNAKLFINISDDTSFGMQKKGKDEVLTAIDDAGKKDDMQNIIRGLPVSIAAIESKLCRYGISIRADTKYSIDLKSYIEINGLGKVYNGLLCMTMIDDYRETLLAKMAYERFIECGGFILRKGDSIGSFIKNNNMIDYSAINFGRLNSNCRYPISIFSFGKLDSKRIAMQELICSKGNSSLLMLSLSGLAVVVDC